MGPDRSISKNEGLLLAILPPPPPPRHSCLQSEWEVKKETSVHWFELADKIMERGRLEALGGVEVKGGFFTFSLFDLRLKTWQSS